MAREERLEIRLATEEKTAYEKAAAIEGMAISVWIRMVLKKAAAKTLADKSVAALGTFKGRR